MPDNPKLRVAHIITQLELGGAQRNTLYTIAHLDKTNFEACLISGPGGILDDEARTSGVPHFFVPTLIRPIRPIRDLRATIEIYKILRHLRPDVVHTHSSKAGILGRLAAYLAGVPVIVHTFHGFGFTPAQRRPIRRLLILAERFCAMLSTHLVFVSEENRTEAAALKIGPHTPRSLIRSGIEMNFPAPSWSGVDRRSASRPGLRDELGMPAGAWVVTYIGNFKPQKNPLDLVKVAEQVLTRDREVYFLLVGDGELREAVQKQITLHNLGDRVSIIGWRKRREDIRDVLGFSNAFYMTSLWEGLPRSLVEAFAARLPAVAYAADGVRDILKDGETGFLITPGDTALAAEKLLWLKANPDIAKGMGERGRQSVEKEFDIDFMVRQQEELYAKLFDKVPLKEYYLPALHA